MLHTPLFNSTPKAEAKISEEKLSLSEKVASQFGSKISEKSSILDKMATDMTEEEGLPKIPNMEYAELLYMLQNKNVSVQEKSDAKSRLLKGIEENSML